MAPLEGLSNSQDKELTVEKGVDVNLEVPHQLEETLNIVGVNENVKSSKAFVDAMAKALDTWMLSSLPQC